MPFVAGNGAVVQWRMDVDEASRVLGVAPGADLVALRSAYRQLIRVRHPDLAGVDHTADAARIIEAYSVLRRVPVAAPPVAPPASPTTSGPAGPDDDRDDRSVVAVPDADTIVVRGPADLTLRVLLDACHELGEVTYVDLGAGLVQMVVTFEGGPACLLLVTARRGARHIDVHLAVDSLEVAPPPPAAAVVALLADVLRRRAGPGPTDR